MRISYRKLLTPSLSAVITIPILRNIVFEIEIPSSSSPHAFSVSIFQFPFILSVREGYLRDFSNKKTRELVRKLGRWAKWEMVRYVQSLTMLDACVAVSIFLLCLRLWVLSHMQSLPIYFLTEAPALPRIPFGTLYAP